MCIRDSSPNPHPPTRRASESVCSAVTCSASQCSPPGVTAKYPGLPSAWTCTCLLYTSDAADDM
eukprot:6811581-Alexandrium_andersonii.AAC.1